MKARIKPHRETASGERAKKEGNTMTFPPPPGLVILAYQFGKISQEEMLEMIRLWHEKHEEVNGDFRD